MIAINLPARCRVRWRGPLSASRILFEALKKKSVFQYENSKSCTSDELGWMGQRSQASCFGSDRFLRSLPHLSFCFLGCFREWLKLNWKRT